jgi:predicted nucleotide-binding protein (sugar kinase/HSP70/actin superfamily)
MEEKKKKERVITMPHLGNYYIVFKPLLELLGDRVLIPPPITKRTIELGLKYSPESACIPFKYNLGNYIESLEKGANVLIQAGGGCRFGYYFEVQIEILRKLGYQFEFIKIPNNIFTLFNFLNVFKKFNRKISYYSIIKKFVITIYRLRVLDIIEEFMRKNMGFEKEKGAFENCHQQFLCKLGEIKRIKEIKKLKKEYLKKMEKIEIDKPQSPIKVAILGELYVLMEPFSNFYLEKELAKKNIEIYRFCNLSSLVCGMFFNFFLIKKHVKQARPYLKHHIGAHGTETVGLAHELIKNNFDGIIHIKPFGCMPEVNAMSALHKISRNYNFPIIYFSYDSQTSETGIRTRLEAFYDMLIMKKNRDKDMGKNEDEEE